MVPATSTVKAVKLELEKKVTPPQAKPRSDRQARREAILDVASEVFLAEGFAAASMSSIAARLGGSKGTLYNYFRSKDELFAAYVQRHCAWQSEAMFGLLSGDKAIEPTLTELGVRYLTQVLSDFSLANFRLIVAEAQRSPEIGRIFYETGPMHGAGLLADYLTQAATRGEFHADDPLGAAHQFLGLCRSRLLKARQCNYMPEPAAEEIAAEVAAAVRTFLAAYGARPAPAG